MDILSISLEDYFNSKLDNLSVQRETRAYILGIFHKYESAQQDLSKKSLTLEFIRAKENYNFALFQNVGDWIFWMETVHHTSSEYQETLAKLSYYRCYQMLNRQWKLFEELADEFEIIVEQLRLEI